MHLFPRFGLNVDILQIIRNKTNKLGAAGGGSVERKETIQRTAKMQIS